MTMMDWIAPITSANVVLTVGDGPIIPLHFWRRCSGNPALCCRVRSCLCMKLTVFILMEIASRGGWLEVRPLPAATSVPGNGFLPALSPRSALHFRQATAYVGSRRSRPCIRTTMPELIRLTIASSMISAIACSDCPISSYGWLRNVIIPRQFWQQRLDHSPPPANLDAKPRRLAGSSLAYACRLPHHHPG